MLRRREIAIALILIGPTTTGANLRKLRMHDRAIHIRALIYELVISVILLTTLIRPDLLRVVYFAVTHFADVRIMQCVVDLNQSAGRSCRCEDFLGRSDPSLLHAKRKFNHSEAEDGNACAGNYSHETHGILHSGWCTPVKVSGSVIIIVGLV